MRAPLVLYRIRVGRYAVGELFLWLFGHPHIRIAHVGRITGIKRQVVLELIHHDARSGERFVAAMWGPDSDWYRNLCATDAIEVETAGRRFAPLQRMVGVEETQDLLDDYQRRNPLWSRICKLFIRRPFTAEAMPMVAFTERPTIE
jgi:deazaflavin-dependent oxidoreductase (nitroreductase family)